MDSSFWIVIPGLRSTAADRIDRIGHRKHLAAVSPTLRGWSPLGSFPTGALGLLVGIPVVISVVVASTGGVWVALVSRVRAIEATVVAALLASPLSWPAYAFVAMPGWFAVREREGVPATAWVSGVAND